MIQPDLRGCMYKGSQRTGQAKTAASDDKMGTGGLRVGSLSTPQARHSPPAKEITKISGVDELESIFRHTLVLRLGLGSGFQNRRQHSSSKPSRPEGYPIKCQFYSEENTVCGSKYHLSAKRKGCHGGYYKQKST